MFVGKATAGRYGRGPRATIRVVTAWVSPDGLPYFGEEANGKTACAAGTFAAMASREGIKFRAADGSKLCAGEVDVQRRRYARVTEGIRECSAFKLLVWLNSLLLLGAFVATRASLSRRSRPQSPHSSQDQP